MCSKGARALEVTEPGRGPEIAATITAILKPRLLDLVEEVERVVMYTAAQLRGASIDRVYLLGSLARWPGAERLFDSLLSPAVNVMNPFAAFETRSDAAIIGDLDPIAGVAIATGCALREDPADG